MIAPGLYIGAVMHRRLKAPPHRFAYSGFWLALDLDAFPRLRLLSRDRRNLFSLDARDHADGKPGDLRAKVAAKAEGIDVSGRMILLTTPRLFGFTFNPLSAYFCHDAGGRPSAMAWEVSNTFGARHTYVIAIDDVADGVVRQSCAKLMHVSPFLDMGLTYQFRVEVLGEALKIGIVDRGPDGAVLAAAVTATRRELTDAALLRLALAAPWATLKVMAAIHWEALKLFLKGAKFRSAPPGSEHPTAEHAVSLHRAEAKRSPTKAISEAADIRLRLTSPPGNGETPAGAA
jgi:DUF1365 family protein